MYCSIHNLTNANLFGYAIIELITISRTVETRGAEGAPDPTSTPATPSPHTHHHHHHHHFLEEKKFSKKNQKT